MDVKYSENFQFLNKVGSKIRKKRETVRKMNNIPQHQPISQPIVLECVAKKLITSYDTQYEDCSVMTARNATK